MYPSGTENIFYANSFCYCFGKLIDFNFVTIVYQKSGAYRCHTNIWDKMRLATGVAFYCWMFYDSVVKSNFSTTKRSIIFDLGSLVYGKIQLILPAFSISQMYYFRIEYFNILQSLHLIDKKVRFLMYEEQF